MSEVLENPLPDAPRPIAAFAVIRVPFFLEPLYDEEQPYIESNRERLLHKWRGKEGWERQKQRHDLKGRGLEAGISHFNLDRLASNSMASHRLIQFLGKTYGLQVSENIYDVLNEYYFVQGHSLNDRPRLAKVVAHALAERWKHLAHESNQTLLEKDPPSEDFLLDFLNGQQGRTEIEEAIATLNRLGVHGIPKFIIEGQTVVDGAVHSSVLAQVFRGIERRGEVAGGPVFGSILGVPDSIVSQGSHRREREDLLL